MKKQLQFGQVDIDVLTRFDKIVWAISIRKGKSVSRIKAFLMMLKDAEEKYGTE